MFLHLLFTLTLMRMTFGHPSLYLVEIADKKEGLIDDMVNILQEADVANRSLTEEEIEQVSKDYSDYCNCVCNVSDSGDYGSFGGISKWLATGIAKLLDNGDCHCICSPCSGGDAHNG